MTSNGTKVVDIATYEALFMEHYVALTRTAYRLVNDTGAAEDIVQDAFCKFWEKKDQLQITTSLKSYFFQMVINTSLNYLKKNKALQIRETEYSTNQNNDVDTTTDQLNFKETEKLIEKAINNLPPTCRIVFLFSRYEHLSYKQIAAQLGISVKAVENHMMKALKQLRGALGLLIFLKIFF